MKKVYFRADASATIGYGHFIRTLALADMLKDDFDCTFFTCHPTLYQVSEMEKVCLFITLQEETHYDDFLSYLQGDEIIVLDNYFFSSDYQKLIKEKGCKLVCFDDLHDKHYYADIVIGYGQNQTALISAESYSQLCLGLQWVPLRPEFRRNFRPMKSFVEIKYIVVSLGGSASYSLLNSLLSKIDHFFDLEDIIVIIGEEEYTSPKLKANLNIFRNITAQDIVTIFTAVDFGFFSASTICIEALACGLPFACGYYVDNQVEFYHYLCSEKIAHGVGNLYEYTTIGNEIYNFKSEFDCKLLIQTEVNYKNIIQSLCL
ncbi:UDP-2,4-diacetamido-2,4,6-trideoxy-beta-L-altropyranose hydrolase [Bacteroides oleiciplenus]|uniref:UDP-2,4-diacetamido-2,4, 6-trideoxy-beta-L-altropyranose hydrolase n=1 Tax=Bacteroides oleiciplenus TaxID=626931 RepID=A0A3E5B6P5_9BACE|nr:UDP-2,4-diacetamido-2,4,6-trideoxy-beta-L-altropyranose hydrolase [Bacteroides oleiciplenus]RGN33226.1 UDP-2,4-diacetamido-2,4,6-trideoxy-beta-L-altropyranose hydrolase [Bacteroides oleiciplenus]